LLTFIRGAHEEANLGHLAGMCRSVDYAPMPRSKGLNAYHAAKSLLLGDSFIISRDRQSKMHSLVSQGMLRTPDLIYADHLQMLQYVPPNAPCPVLLDEHNVEWRIIERMAAAGMRWAERRFAALEWPKLKAWELNACRRADMVLSVTEGDRGILVENGVPAERVKALPIGVDTGFFRPVPLKKESGIILSFGTMSWPPNVDAVLYFAQSIYPLIRARVPGVRFKVVGANPPREIRLLPLADPSIEVTGFVEDIQDAALDAAVFVVPLRIGSGMRVKILSAMAMGLPIVTTHVGCEGISARHREQVLIAESPEEFAGSVAELLGNWDMRVQLGAAARLMAEETYSWPPILAQLDKVLDNLAPR
jgi:glycosyltransferase involved in cell wall biosynthesis